MKTTTLFRPVGPEELALIAASEFREFPPRLPEQPIFYPVLNEEYARQIARDWNVKASGAGYVTRFDVASDFLRAYPEQTVGGSIHRELWIPAEDLTEMNRNIVGEIEVIAEFFAEGEKMNPNEIPYSDRILGALWGSLAGDALGVPVEFQSRETVRNHPVTEMRGFGTHRQPAGTWSDDSSMLLCTVESLTERGALDTTDLGDRFVRWEREAYWTPHGSVFDIGNTTARAISRLASGTPPEEAGGSDVNSNGNGSLMRIIPIALWFHGDSAEAMAEHAQRASSLTHRHARSEMACAFYCLLVKELIHGSSPQDGLRAAFEAFSRIYARPPFAEEMPLFRLLGSGDLDKLPEAEVHSSGYVIHTLLASVWCLLTSRSFEETVLKAVNLGEDTDTTGTVAGGLAGARYGMKAIPLFWEQLLARHDDVESLFTKFLSHFPEHREPFPP